MSSALRPTPQTTPYQLLGGDVTVRRLVARFYELMDSLPEAYGIRKLHPADLSGSAEKLYMFLSGWLGGPQLYVEQHGHPRLRARHLPFHIGNAEAIQWMQCMTQAMTEIIETEELRNWLESELNKLAAHMRNVDA
jgi:hemoglobin